ncbi:hypothetical protein Y032_0035g3012 [Ancylostoma ceylanicum]|uniref:Uncharacterized protein n=1 Tax=Ancylostoma ceylanicum TaxID=53326 RepID=A0A016ULT5_9BILA|nr:hypothetical protein Y032_0035g3012 [Ancylostoma ceylanicum]
MPYVIPRTTPEETPFRAPLLKKPLGGAKALSQGFHIFYSPAHHTWSAISIPKSANVRLSLNLGIANIVVLNNWNTGPRLLRSLIPAYVSASSPLSEHGKLKPHVTYPLNAQ